MHSARRVCVTYNSRQILITSFNINRLVNGEWILFPLRYELNLCTNEINFSLHGVKKKSRHGDVLRTVEAWIPKPVRTLGIRDNPLNLPRIDPRFSCRPLKQEIQTKTFVRISCISSRQGNNHPGYIRLRAHTLKFLYTSSGHSRDGQGFNIHPN